MNETQHTPTFNMKVVVRETGLKPDTLRAWERRYGMPDPQRTAGGHRLYSQYEIDMLKWLIERQDEGMNISHAVEMWQHLVESGENPLQQTAVDPIEPLAVLPLGGEVVGKLREAWLKACMAFEEHPAQQILAQAFAQFPVEVVCFEILQKSLTRVGQMWYEGEATVQQEHFVSSLAIRQLEALLAAAAAPTQDVRLLVACPPLEQHTFMPLLLTLLFRRRGWEVVYLGANVPVDRLETAVQTVKPHLVILSVQTLFAAGNMMPMAHALQELTVPFAYGGSVFNYLPLARRYVPGSFLGHDLLAAVEMAAKLVQSKKQPDPTTAVPAQYQAAMIHFVAQRAAIDAYVQQQVDLPDMPITYLLAANKNLGDNIIAALALGDMDLLTANINWIQGLLMNYHYRMPEEVMGRYLQVYQDGVAANLDERGALINRWFDQLRQSIELAHKVRGS